MDGYTEKVFKERCLFFNGTSLSTWMFILRFMLRIHRCSFNRKKTHTHSPDKFQPASFLSCFTPNRLFCLSMYMSLLTLALGFYLWAHVSVWSPSKPPNQSNAPSTASKKNPPQLSLQCVQRLKNQPTGTHFNQLQAPKTDPDALANMSLSCRECMLWLQV